MELLAAYGDEEEGKAESVTGKSTQHAPRHRVVLRPGAYVPEAMRREARAAAEHRRLPHGASSDLPAAVGGHRGRKRRHSGAAPRAVPTSLWARRSGAHEAQLCCARWAEPLVRRPALLATTALDGSVSLWNLESVLDVRSRKRGVPLARAFHQHAGPVRECAWLRPVGGGGGPPKLATCGNDARCLVTDVESGAVEATLQLEAAATSVAAHPSEPSLLLAGLERGGVVQWDLRTAKEAVRYKVRGGRWARRVDVFPSPRPRGRTCLERCTRWRSCRRPSS